MKLYIHILALSFSLSVVNAQDLSFKLINETDNNIGVAQGVGLGIDIDLYFDKFPDCNVGFKADFMNNVYKPGTHNITQKNIPAECINAQGETPFTVAFRPKLPPPTFVFEYSPYLMGSYAECGPLTKGATYTYSFDGRSAKCERTG